MVIDVSSVKRYIKPKADSTLLNMKKVDLIEYVRTLERNYNVAVSFNEQLARNIEDMMKNGVIPQQWISVENEMPHAEYGESDNVLAVDGHGIVEMLYFDGGCWCYPTGEPVFYEDPSWRITHWMPLPEPPRVQGVSNGTDHV